METMLSLTGVVASLMPTMSLTIFFFSLHYVNHMTTGLVYKVRLSEKEEGQRHSWNSGDG